ncbi:MAG: hypothetical protein HYW77_01220 [Parcubacteria group bacterium]|nr:hypothetical protein [Parcubacteria group bacterium]
MVEIHRGHQHYLWFLIAILLLVFAGAIFLFQNGESIGVSDPFPTSTIKLGRTYTVYYNNGVFSPTILQVKVNDTIRFKNESDKLIYIISDSHPDHNLFAELDSKGSIKKGDSWVFVFNKKGIWGYHNEKSPEEGGTIIVK